MAKLNLKTLADELKKKLQQGASTVGKTVFNSLPPVQAYNAVKQIRDPQSSFNRALDTKAPSGLTYRQAISQTNQRALQDLPRDFNRGASMLRIPTQISNPALRTLQTVGSGMIDIGRGTYGTISAKNPRDFFSNTIKTAYGAGKIYAAGKPIFQVPNLAVETPQLGKADLVRRFSSGVLGGVTNNTPLVDNTPSKNINLNVPIVGKVEFDPVKIAGQMIGFVKNPTNEKLYGFTGKFLNDKLVSSLWKKGAIIGFKGGLEGLFQGLGSLPDNASEEEIKNYLASQIAFGSASELGFRSAGAVAGKMWNSLKPYISDTSGKWNVPVTTMKIDPTTGQRIVVPMWKYRLQDMLGLQVKDVNTLSVDDYAKYQKDIQSKIKTEVEVPTKVGEIKVEEPKIPISKVRTTNTPIKISRTTSTPIIQKKTITRNPIKEDITGVNKTGIASKIREVVQDNWIRVKNLQRQKGVKVTESSNPYLAEELYHGKVGTRIENVKDTVTNIDKDILVTSKKLDIPDVELKSKVNKYLQAKHAPERNAIHGDGAAGITNAEAKKYLTEIAGTKESKQIERVGSEIKKLNDQTLDILYEGRVISKEIYDQLRNVYKNHVPLNRVMSDTDDVVDVLTNKGFNVKGTGIRSAKGSKKEVADILTNTVANLEAAIVRAEKNRVNLATLKFARENPQLGVFEEIKPKEIGNTFEGKPILAEVKDPSVLSIMEDGKRVYLKIKDEKLATVFQGIGNEKLPAVFKLIETFTKFYSGLHTRFNPEFAASNIIRDTQEMAVFMASQKEIGFKGAVKTIRKDPASAKAVIESIMGKNTAGARLYKQMKMDGGTTGGMALSTRKQVELDLDSIIKLNRSKPRQAAQKLLQGFDNWNTVFEDATRLSVYRQALDNGMSRSTAASLAKNSTVNFNKKGTGGPIINSLYMFSNASIQGSVKMLRAMKNPKVAVTVTTLIGSSVFAANKWNDSVDPDWREKVTEWDRNSNMVVMLPTEEGSKYITIPVSWGLKPLKVASDVAYDLSTGNTNNVGEAAVKISSSAFDAYNPAGGEDLVSAATPTILDTPVDIARNRSWSGANIKPDWLKGLPMSEQRYKDTDKTTTGKIAVKISDTLSEKTKGVIEISPNDLIYAYQAYIGGLGKFATRVVNTSIALAKKDELVTKEIPFLNRFLKTRSEEQVQKSVAYKKQDDFFKSLRKYETGSFDQKEAIKNYLRQQSSDKERQSTLFKLRDQGFDTKGISYSAKKLGVEEGLTPQSEKITFVKSSDDPKNIIDKISIVAQGITKDPQNTLKAIFTQEELRKIEGNAVILKRQEFLNKSNDKSLERDHIIPLALGGDNSESNLMYVPKEYHEEKTKFDMQMIKKLQSGEITKQEAQKQVKEWVSNHPHTTYISESGASNLKEQKTKDTLTTDQKTAVKEVLSAGTENVDPLIKKYFPEDQWLNAQAVMMGESGGNPSAVGDNYPINGQTIPSYGLFQIRALEGRPDSSVLTNAEENVKYAAQLYKEQGWSPWTVARNLGIVDGGTVSAESISKATGKTFKIAKAKKPKKITFKVTNFKSTPITIKKKGKTAMPTIKFAKPMKNKIKIVRKYSIK